jgi:hypothetical protein
MEAYLKKHLGSQWGRFRSELENRGVESLAKLSWTQPQAQQFIGEVRERAKGNIPSPTLETLLLFNPIYQKRPEQEFLDGYRYRYSSASEHKARGLDFTIELPKTWLAKEGNRPHVLQKFVSQNGRGPQLVILFVTELALPPGVAVTAADVKEILNPTDIADFLPAGATYIDSGAMTLETLPGFWARYRTTMSRVRNTFSSEWILYGAFYRDKMIQIQAQVLTEANGEKVEDGEFSKYETLFDLIANSFVLHTLYK